MKVVKMTTFIAVSDYFFFQNDNISISVFQYKSAVLPVSC